MHNTTDDLIVVDTILRDGEEEQQGLLSELIGESIGLPAGATLVPEFFVASYNNTNARLKSTAKEIGWLYKRLEKAVTVLEAGLINPREFETDTITVKSQGNRSALSYCKLYTPNTKPGMTYMNALASASAGAGAMWSKILNGSTTPTMNDFNALSLPTRDLPLFDGNASFRYTTGARLMLDRHLPVDEHGEDVIDRLSVEEASKILQYAKEVLSNLWECEYMVDNVDLFVPPVESAEFLLRTDEIGSNKAYLMNLIVSLAEYVQRAVGGAIPFVNLAAMSVSNED